jgi:hypothetical protein
MPTSRSRIYTPIPRYLRHPRRLLCRLCSHQVHTVAYAHFADSRLSCLESSIFVRVSCEPAFYLHVYSDSTPRLSVSLSSVNVYALCRSSCSSTCPCLLPPPHPLRPPSPATRVCIVFAAFAPSGDQDPHLSDTNTPRLSSSPLGLAVPTYTHIYRRRLPCSCCRRRPPLSASASVVLFGSLCPR